MDNREYKLRNGKMVFGPAVVSLDIAVRRLMESDPLAFWELVEVSRDSSHVIFSEVQSQVLHRVGLLDGPTVNHKPHEIIRDVVASMVEGELPHISIVNPLHEDERKAATGA